MEKLLIKILEEKYKKTFKTATKEEIYYCLLELVKNKMRDERKNTGDKKLYYISAEFLIGKLLSNNLINLGLFDETKEVLNKYGFKLSEIEELEPEPSLGNGGLGRLAACFLDSIAALGLNGDGVGLCYHDGLFLQKIKDLKQHEEPDAWIEDKSWLDKTEVEFEVEFKDFKVKSNMYDISVPGYNGGCNKLHLFDVATADESIIESGIDFDKRDIKKNLTLFLYPDDSDKDGRLLRIYQQYFMVSNAAQLIIKDMEEKGYPLERLYEHAVIQINDTHPTMVIPELIRLLLKRGIDFDNACEIVSKTCAYTNHTILAEALEKWPVDYLEEVVPELMPIIKRLDEKVREKFDDERVYIIKDDIVHMAHIDIHMSFAVNGVAALHTDILKSTELRPFYEIYPEKFNNKTNGITFRRWLVHCNAELTELLDSTIGKDYRKNADELEKLLEFENDSEVLHNLLRIKENSKRELADYLYKTQKIEINPDSIFDIQIKRLHEYKRQQMNALYAIYKYKQIKKGILPKRPITMIFGAKAAPAYTIAKDIIHLILCLSRLINEDDEVNKYLKIVMVENYNVTKAEKLIPACDISEQISLASKEASGTGNMKLMLNGAVTLGTLDGANVEISELVGSDNIYIFGEKPERVIELYENESYSSARIYDNDPQIEELVDFIIDKKLIRIGDPVCLARLYKELVSKDWFMTLLDLKDYIDTKEHMLEDFEDREKWSRMMLHNIAKAGYFSADRTIKQYNEDIWKL